MHVLRNETSKIGVYPEKRSIEELLQQGIVVINKPCGPTSHEVSAFAQKILGIDKSGHTGTLDANVSGVLLVLLNNSCKASKYCSTNKKTYECVLRLNKELPKEKVEKALAHFRGKIFQKPPLASAVAKKLRIREIFKLELIDSTDNLYLLHCECEAGTYMRKLCTDLGEVLAVGGEMADLRRTNAGLFNEKQSHTLQELSDAYWLWKEKGNEKELRKMLLPLEDAVTLKKVVTDDVALTTVSQGAKLAMPGVNAFDEGIVKGEFVQIVSSKGELCAIGKAEKDEKELLSAKKGIAFSIERVIKVFGKESS